MEYSAPHLVPAANLQLPCAATCVATCLPFEEREADKTLQQIRTRTGPYTGCAAVLQEAAPLMLTQRVPLPEPRTCRCVLNPLLLHSVGLCSVRMAITRS